MFWSFFVRLLWSSNLTLCGCKVDLCDHNHQREIFTVSFHVLSAAELIEKVTLSAKDSHSINNKPYVISFHNSQVSLDSLFHRRDLRGLREGVPLQWPLLASEMKESLCGLAEPFDGATERGKERDRVKTPDRAVLQKHLHLDCSLDFLCRTRHIYWSSWKLELS